MKKTLMVIEFVAAASLLPGVALAQRGNTGRLPVTDPKLNQAVLESVAYREVCLGSTPAILVYVSSAQSAAGAVAYNTYVPLNMLPWPADKPSPCGASPKPH